MGGGKGRQPEAPNYEEITRMSKESAEVSARVAREQLAWAREQYQQDRALTDRVMATMLPAQEAANRWAMDDRAFYESVFRPGEAKFAEKAMTWDTPERRAQQAAEAQGDVRASFQQQRQNAVAQLAARGVDPSMLGSLKFQTEGNLAEAATQASAANMARRGVEQQGMAYLGEMTNIGKGIPGQYAQQQALAMQGGQQAVASNLATTASGVGSMGTGMQWQGLNNQSISGMQNYSANLFNTQAGMYNQQQQARASMISGIAGAVGMAGGMAMRSDERVKKDLVPVGKLPGTGLTVYDFKFKDDPSETPRRGVLAQDVEKIDPGAVKEFGGVKHVDMDRLSRDEGMMTTAPAKPNGYNVPEDVVRRKGTDFFDRFVEKTRNPAPKKPANGNGNGAGMQTSSNDNDIFSALARA